MRVTVRGVLVGGSVGVLLTTVLLWSQCRPPAPHLPMHQAAHAHGTKQQQQQQLHRSPLQTSRHQAGGAVGGEDTYVEVEYSVGGAADAHHNHHHEGGDGASSEGRAATGERLSEIPCVINHESEVMCKRDQNDVYIPFSFIHNYFEVYGRVEQKPDGTEVFEWSHSYSRVYNPQGPYTPTGTFLNFELYNVEARERVKCISGTEGVPMSTQWQSSGYTYPIQIAQFGLSHYCKHLTESSPKRIMIEDGGEHQASWLEGVNTKVLRVADPMVHTNVLKFKAPESSSKGGAILHLAKIPTQNMLVLSLNLLLHGNASFSVTVEFQDKKTEVVTIHYIRSEKILQVLDRHIYYGLGEQTGWRTVTRNLLIDVHKGATSSPSLRKKFKKVSRSKLTIVSLSLHGEGSVTNITLASAEHLHHFYDAANWLLKHQDEQGGWSIPVPRKVISGVLELGAGWYSAMAQGQAMSLLIRAAHHSGDSRYLKAAVRATSLFSVNATRGGVRTYFPGGYVWYEEYPTNPSLFVLNGFIYSLLGLYDLKEFSGDSSNISGDLFEDGMRSLKRLLPLYDTGWGSLYDLRHFTTHVPPNRARWDYHTTHITQLLLLASIDTDPVISSTAQRWKDYMNGHRSKHN
ncbi:D-glucuronyl C5-epimerase B-like [Homarus americanus]|uniref:D-glucuronyl C5-epimerase B-like n=1 Tax=Homarus americanus TaxID=6706 RepID=UPI001C44CC4E|nr:D-glucuronyl C5-epimerase B-like [Homarus americanus]